jgi:hypothetical protein
MQESTSNKKPKKKNIIQEIGPDGSVLPSAEQGDNEAGSSLPANVSSLLLCAKCTYFCVFLLLCVLCHVM